MFKINSDGSTEPFTPADVAYSDQHKARMTDIQRELMGLVFEATNRAAEGDIVGANLTSHTLMQRIEDIYTDRILCLNVLAHMVGGHCHMHNWYTTAQACAAQIIHLAAHAFPEEVQMAIASVTPQPTYDDEPEQE